MFGSLVVVFPTHHEGGALLLRHRGQEWIFDSDQAPAAKCQPSIGYVAFFSDVEHEVAPVISGHRITLTYNLYFDDGGPVSANDAISEPPQPVNEDAIHEAFVALLESPEFLADGGTLAFGLRHVYPIKRERVSIAMKSLHPIENYLKHLCGVLKGSDSVVYQSACALGFEPVLYLYYEWTGRTDRASPTSPPLGVITDKVMDFNELQADMGQDLVGFAQSEGGILVARAKLREGGGSAIMLESRFESPELLEWVTPMTTFNRQEDVYPARYGPRSKPGLRWVSGYVCLVVRIGKGGDRLAYPTVGELSRRNLIKRMADDDDDDIYM
jgi:hypothetical protein